MLHVLVWFALGVVSFVLFLPVWLLRLVRPPKRVDEWADDPAVRQAVDRAGTIPQSLAPTGGADAASAQPGSLGPAPDRHRQRPARLRA